MMGKIYARAQCVFIWLGDEWDDPWFFDHDEDLVFPGRSQYYYLNSVDGGVSNVTTEAVIDLMRQSRYFTRRWTIQEVRMQPMRYVLAGARFIRFERLEQAMQDSGKPMPLCFAQHCMHILDNVILYSDTKCIDPRDRIFALLALSPRFDRIAPDYAADYTDVYVKFAANCLGQGSLLKILACAVETRTVSSPRRLPSWVPDWQVAIPQTVQRLLALKSRTSSQGPFESGRVHLWARLYWLCRGVVGDFQYSEAVQYIQDWRLKEGLSIHNNAEEFQHPTHACVGCAGHTLSFVEDEGWGLLLTRVSSPSVAQKEECEEFLLVDWFHEPRSSYMATNPFVKLGDLQHGVLRRHAWFDATAIADLTSIALI
ncbi:hypothetical protein LTR27_005688 [Elasticomyces elasticus]|nr:hypothetical protein LTR27_005688 [Elasticomyces elasticus]